VVLLDRSDEELCRSAKVYSWNEAVALANLFGGKDVANAMKLWARKAP
jgi:hypothetical protein